MVNIAWSESFFLKNMLISDRKSVTLFIGIMSLLFRTLKLLISCDIRKYPMPFLRLNIHAFINIRNFNVVINQNVYETKR